MGIGVADTIDVGVAEGTGEGEGCTEGDAVAVGRGVG
jgi:hypothetical protein